MLGHSLRWTRVLLSQSSREQLVKFTGEFFGTFSLVFAGTGAIVVNDVSGGAITHAGIALTFGLVVLAMIYAVGDVSGAHLNPVVTMVFALERKLPLADIPVYLLGQSVGAFAASGVLRVLFVDHATLGATLPAGSWAQSFLLEFILTTILIFVVLRVAIGAKEKSLMAGIAIGAVVALEAMFAGPISGASMNPIRSLAPAVISNRLNEVWIYVVAPTLGGVFALGLYKLCSCERKGVVV